MNKYINQIIHGDCLEVMEGMVTAGIKADMILADLPYGTTNAKWDSIIPLDDLWTLYKKLIKDNGAIVLTAQTPFDKILGVSNLDWLRYEWIYEKPAATGFLNAKKMPMKAHENILVFYKKLPVYNPQMTTGHKPINSYTKSKQTQDKTELYGKSTKEISGGGSTKRYPRSIQTFSSDKQKNYLHPTQKPVALFEYLIKTYTNENEIVLDNVIGSGTTAMAAINTNRNFIGIEKEIKYVEIAKKRIEEVKEYFYKKFPNGDFEDLSKKQAQKIIQGLDTKLPKKPIKGVMNYYF